MKKKLLLFISLLTIIFIPLTAYAATTYTYTRYCPLLSELDYIDESWAGKTYTDVKVVEDFKFRMAVSSVNNSGSEAFINSLLEEEKELENELAEIQEKLHNAKLFKEKLGEMKPDNGVLTDQDKLLKLKQKYERSEVKNIGNETSTAKAKNDIIRDIQIYNTQIIRVYDEQVISIGVYTNAEPVVYYFKNEYSKDDIAEILNHVEEHCKENEIEFCTMQNSLFLE